MKAEDDRFSENLVQCMFFLSALIGFPILGILALVSRCYTAPLFG